MVGDRFFELETVSPFIGWIEKTKGTDNAKEIDAAEAPADGILHDGLHEGGELFAIIVVANLDCEGGDGRPTWPRCEEKADSHDGVKLVAKEVGEDDLKGATKSTNLAVDLSPYGSEGEGTILLDPVSLKR